MDKKSLRTSNDSILNKIDYRIEKDSKLDLESNKNSEKDINNPPAFLAKNNNLILERDEISEYEKINYIRNLENLLSKKTKPEIFFHNTEEKNHFVDRNITKRKLIKKLIEFKQNNLRFFKKNIKLIKNCFSNLKITIKKIEMNYRIKTEIIKELIKNQIKT